MPKPIIVIEVGSIHHDLFCKSLEFMLTSHMTASIREEYHIMMFNETKEERCYIIAPPRPTLASGGIVSGPSGAGHPDHAKEMIVPMPNTLAKLKNALKIHELARQFAQELQEHAKASVAAENKQDDPDDMQELFGYKVRKCTMQELEIMARIKANVIFEIKPDGELIIMSSHIDTPPQS